MRKQNRNAKDKIKKCATQIFFDMPYNEASMRDVASKCNMTVGNIYRYYDNKELLFDEIVKKCYENIIKVIKVKEFVQKYVKAKIGVSEKNIYKNTRFRSHLIDYIVKLINENATELFILLNNSSGSKYENIKNQVFDMAKESIMEMINQIDEDRAEIYAFTAISTLSFILKKEIQNKEKLESNTKLFFIKFFASF